MSRFLGVRLPRPETEDLRKWLDNEPSISDPPHHALHVLSLAIKAALRSHHPRPSKAPTFQSRRPSKSSKREEAARIWQMCLERASGHCECGCGQPHSTSLGSIPEMDHFFGRAKVRQAVSNCWMLRADCHREKTRERPDRATWLRRFREHAERHGYRHEVAEVDKKLGGSLFVRDTERKRRGTP